MPDLGPLLEHIRGSKSLAEEGDFEWVQGILEKYPGKSCIIAGIDRLMAYIDKFERGISVVMKNPYSRFKEIVGSECGICRMNLVPPLVETVGTAEPGTEVQVVQPSVAAAYLKHQA